MPSLASSWSCLCQQASARPWGAALAEPARMARVHGAAALSADVDAAKRRRGEGREHGRMGADRGGQALAAGRAGVDELVGVLAVDLGARLAACRPARAARLQHDPVRLVGRVEDGPDLAACRVRLRDGAVKPYRPLAAARRAGLALPAGVPVW